MAKKKTPKKSAKKIVKKSTPKKAAKPAKTKAVAKSKAVAHRASSISATKPKFSALLSPLEDRVLVQMEAGGERRSAGGLILISDSSDVAGHVRAQVVAVGPGRRNKKGQIRPLDLQIGDWVLLAEYVGDEVELNSVKLKIVREGEILGVVGNG